MTDIVSFKENIRSALSMAGYARNVSVRAYYGGDKKQPPAGITFVHGGAFLFSLLVGNIYWTYMSLICICIYICNYSLKTWQNA